MEDYREQPVLRVEPIRNERFLPEHFYDVLAHRYFPVLSLTYIATVAGISLKLSQDGNGFLFYFLQDPHAYQMGYWIAGWVSVPAILWIFVRGTIHIRKVADLWYKVTSGLMIVTLLVSFLLFPMGDTGFALRLFMVATIPVFLVQYFCFVREGLPPRMSWPLTVAGITFLVYGLIL